MVSGARVVTEGKRPMNSGMNLRYFQLTFRDDLEPLEPYPNLTRSGVSTSSSRLLALSFFLFGVKKGVEGSEVMLAVKPIDCRWLQWTEQY